MFKLECRLGARETDPDFEVFKRRDGQLEINIYLRKRYVEGTRVRDIKICRMSNRAKISSEEQRSANPYIALARV